MIQSLQLIMVIKVFSSAVGSMRFISRNIFLVYLDAIARDKYLALLTILTPLTDLSCDCVLCPCFIPPGMGNCKNRGTGDENYETGNTSA